MEKTTRVCSFDRAGLGQSQELPVLPRTSEQHALELDRLLTGLNVTGDFIAVGHSYAGFNMRTFNRDFPRRIKGMVMIDTGKYIAKPIRFQSEFLKLRFQSVQ